MKENIGFPDAKQKLSNWKDTFENFSNKKTSSLPLSSLKFEDSELGSWFISKVEANLPDNDNAKKLGFYIKKNLLIANDIYELTVKKDDYLPEYLTEEFSSSYNMILKFMDALEGEL